MQGGRFRRGGAAFEGGESGEIGGFGETGGFYGEGFHDDRTVEGEGVGGAMAFFEGAGHGVGLGELDGECRVRAVIAELGPADDPDAVLGHVLGEEFGAGGALQVVGGLQDAGHRGGFQGTSTDCSRMAVVSASPMPRADRTPAMGGTRTVRMPSESATMHACWPPAPPKVVSAYRVTSWPFWTEIRLTALAMLATAIWR